LTELARESYSSSHPKAVQEWEAWAALIAPQNDSAEEYCAPSGRTPLIIPLKHFLPQSPIFSDTNLIDHERVAFQTRPKVGEDREYQQFRTGKGFRINNNKFISTKQCFQVSVFNGLNNELVKRQGSLLGIPLSILSLCG
jgi:hypothetical protein